MPWDHTTPTSARAGTCVLQRCTEHHHHLEGSRHTVADRGRVLRRVGFRRRGSVGSLDSRDRSARTLDHRRTRVPACSPSFGVPGERDSSAPSLARLVPRLVCGPRAFTVVADGQAPPGLDIAIDLFSVSSPGGFGRSPFPVDGDRGAHGRRREEDRRGSKQAGLDRRPTKPAEPVALESIMCRSHTSPV